MAAGINDKFKKVSADNSYAVATTVRTARTVGGGTTLEAFDLSKWADATAVNFLTYRKTTDPVTNVTTVTNRTGWTALVNTGSNTLTNLTVAPGYTDLGHQVGDYIEPVQMSKWANDLVDGLLTSHNQNGTLKNNSVTTAAIANGAVKAQNIDFASLLAWVPDYANMDSTSRGSTWTVVSRGFVKLYSSDYRVGSVYDGEPFEINGKKVGRMAQEAQSASGNGARMATLSGIFPVAAGDNVKVIGGNDAQIFFIPGRWV